MNSAQHLFIELLRISINEQESISRIPSFDEWNEIYSLSSIQSVSGVCFDAVQKLLSKSNDGLAGINLPHVLYLKWLGKASILSQASEHHIEVLGCLNEKLQNEGIRVLFMKGLVCASRYPNPLLRQCGDIDFVVSKDSYQTTLKTIESVAQVDYSIIHEHHGMARMDGVSLEPHFKIHNFQNPFNDRQMRHYQEWLLQRNNHNRVTIGNVQVETFPLEFEGMHLITHMVNHVFEEGLGLRQVMDFAMWLRSCKDTIDKNLYSKYLRSMHMERSAKIFTRICEKYFGIDASKFGYRYSIREIVFADLLMDDILDVGNFARGAKEDHSAGWASYKWVTKRSIRLGYLCPSEAYWWPVSKFCRYIVKQAK